MVLSKYQSICLLKREELGKLGVSICSLGKRQLDYPGLINLAIPNGSNQLGPKQCIQLPFELPAHRWHFLHGRGHFQQLASLMLPAERLRLFHF